MGKRIMERIFFLSKGSGDALCKKWMLADGSMR